MTQKDTTTPKGEVLAEKFVMPRLDERPEDLEPLFQGKKGTALTIFMVVYFLWHIVYTIGLFTSRWIYFSLDEYVAISVGATFVLVYLVMRFRKTSKGVPWYDWILMAMGISGSVYIYFHIPQFFERSAIDNTGVIIGTLFIISCLEGVRRGMGLVIAAMVVFFFAYAMFSNYFPGVLWSTGFTYKQMIASTFAHESGMLGMIGRLFSELMIVFMLFATTIQVSGAGKAILKTALGALGHLTGGPAKVAVVASGAFGSIAPAAAANVMITGVITIPMMKRTGQTPEFAAGVEAVSSILGTLTPPVMGAIAFIVAEWLQMPYYLVMLAAFVPSVMFFFTLFWMVHFQALSKDLPRISKESLPSAREGVKDGWYYLIPIVLFVYLLSFLQWSPQSAVVYSWFLLVIVGQFKKEDRITWDKLQTAMRISLKMITMLGPMLVSIGIVLASLEMTGMTIRFTGLLVGIAGGSQILLLLLSAGAAFIMGMGMPAMAIYFVLAALIAPALEQTGITPIAAHLFILYAMTMSYWNPPVMPGTIFTAAIAKANVWGVAWTAIRLGIALYIAPLVIIYNPALLLQGGYSIGEILTPLIPCLVGSVCLAAGIQGWLLRKANWPQRILLMASGLLLIFSFSNLGGGVNLILGLSAIAVLLLVLLWQGVIQKFFGGGKASPMAPAN